MKRLRTVLFLLSLAVIAVISIAVPLISYGRFPPAVAQATAAATTEATASPITAPTATIAVAPTTPTATNTAAPTSTASVAATVAAPSAPTATPAPTAAAPVIPPGLGAIADLQARLQEVYGMVNPSVVHIWGNTAQQMPAQGEEGQGEIVFTVPDPCNYTDPLPLRSQGSLGSGFVWDKEGHIITNNHLLQGAERLFVTFSDGLTVPAEVVGQDQHTDLAVLRADAPAERLRPVSLATSTVITPGLFTVAVGNPFGCTGSMSFGIVSAVGRSLPAWDLNSPSGVTAKEVFADIIQTDTPINPGNSGGVLADLQGRLVGVTFAMVETVDTGVGFAIPSVVLQRVVPTLIEKGSYQPPWLGLTTRTLMPQLATAMGLPETQQGALVDNVTVGGPADKAGVRGSGKRITVDGEELSVGGDIILSIDGQRVTRAADVDTYLARYAEPGKTIQLTVVRDGEETQLDVTVGALSKPEEAVKGVGQSGGAWIGIDGVTLTPDVASAMDLKPDQRGVLIESVVSSGPADLAELRGGYKKLPVEGGSVLIGGDVIVKADGKAVDKLEDLADILGQKSPGEELTLVILRDAKELEELVTLSTSPQETM